MVRLFCAIVGGGGVFSVRVEGADWNDKYSVNDLKKAIMNKMYEFPAEKLQLFLAKQRSAWLASDSEDVKVLRNGGQTATIEALLHEENQPHGTSSLQKLLTGMEQLSTGQIHVLVVPGQVGPDGPLPRTIALHEPEKYDAECNSLNDWDVDAVHQIPSIWEFMRSLGGCTSTGKIFWRMEEKQIASLLLDGWFRESTPNNLNTRARKRSIVMGPPGVGKSTLLCVMAFHLVFKHKKNVLMYRRLTQREKDNCLLYLGHDNGRVVYFALLSCKASEAERIYRVLWEQHGIWNVWLLHDGFRYQDIPEGLRTFKMLATSQRVNLTSRECTGAYCCLLPCWSKKDLLSLGGLIYKFTEDDMEERFYYSGGNVHEFTLATAEDVRISVEDAISDVDDVSNVLSGRSEFIPLCHVFVKDTNEPRHFISCRYWDKVIDSEYAVLALSVRLNPFDLFQIYTWAESVGNGSLAGSTFRVYLHRMGADNELKLFALEYDPTETKRSNEPQRFDGKLVDLKTKMGRAICCGTASDYDDDVKQWRDDEALAYWFPACYDFPDIDSIVKLKSASGKKSNVAFLHFTTADHIIDGQQLQKMIAIFYPDDVKDAGDTEPPIYIAVCPDIGSCEALILKPSPPVLAATKSCRVFVGFCLKVSGCIPVTGAMDNWSYKALPAPPDYIP